MVKIEICERGRIVNVVYLVCRHRTRSAYRLCGGVRKKVRLEAVEESQVYENERAKHALSRNIEENQKALNGIEMAAR